MLEIEALDVSRDPAPARQTSGLKAGVVRRPRAAVNTAHRSDATGGATDVHGRRLGGTRPCQALLRVTHRDRRTATPATALPARQHPVSTQTRDLLAAVNSLEAVLRQCRPKPDADGAQAFVKSSGDITVSVVPVLQDRVQPEHDPASRVARHALTGQGRSCDVAARFRQPVGARAYRCARQGALHREHPVSGTRANGDAASAGCRLQRPERLGAVRVGISVGQAGGAFLFDEHAAADRSSTRVRCFLFTASPYPVLQSARANPRRRRANRRARGEHRGHQPDPSRRRPEALPRRVAGRNSQPGPLTAVV